MTSDRWHRHWLRIALDYALMSKDPATQVGAVIIGPDMEQRSEGFNGFPRGVADTDARLNSPEWRREHMVHAECNAIYKAARIGISLKGCTLYLVCTDSTGHLWGGAPCLGCACALIQAGIVKVVALPFKLSESRWRESVVEATRTLQEAGVEIEVLPRSFVWSLRRPGEEQ